MIKYFEGNNEMIEIMKKGFKGNTKRTFEVRI
jgi:hypothetical protein